MFGRNNCRTWDRNVSAIAAINPAEHESYDKSIDDPIVTADHQQADKRKSLVVIVLAVVVVLLLQLASTDQTPQFHC